jgi:hypothetical protein
MKRFGTLCFVLLVGACTAGNVDTIDPPMEEDGGMPTAQTDAGGDIPTIQLAPLVQSTYWDTAPVHGRGPAGGTVLIETETQGSFTGDIDGNGDFCIDVPLVESSVNTFSIRGVTASGTLGEPISASIRQDGEPPAPPVGAPAQNVALGASISTTTSVDAGSLRNAIDGDRATLVELDNAIWDDDYVYITLQEHQFLEKMGVYSASGCILEKYWVATAAKDAPCSPGYCDTDWQWWSIDEMNGADLWEWADPIEVKHLVIWFDSEDCGNVTGGYHKLNEVEAWTRAGVTPPPPQAPSCAGGG